MSGRDETGPESLYGRINTKDMGIRSFKESAPAVKKQSNSQSGASTKFASEYAGLKYCPKTKEARQAFDYLASIIHSLMGSDQPHDVTLSAADEVLEILKMEDLRELDQKSRIEELIGSIGNEEFTQLVNVSRRVTDYTVNNIGTMADDGADEEGVAVVFEEDDEDNEIVPVLGSDSEEELNIVKEDQPAIFDEQEDSFIFESSNKYILFS